MHGDESRSALDSLIDGVARAMATREPSPRLRSRVTERITTRQTWWQVPMWRPVAVGAVIVTILAAFLAPDNGHVDPQMEQRTAMNESLPAGLVPTKVRIDPNLPEARRALRRSKDGRAVGVPEPVSTSDESSPSMPASGIDSLEIEPLALEQIGPDLVKLDAVSAPMPLAIEQLRIEPLSVSQVE